MFLVDSNKVLHNPQKVCAERSEKMSPNPVENDLKPSKQLNDGSEKKQMITPPKVKLINSINIETESKKHIDTPIPKMFRRFDHTYFRRLSESDGWNTDDDSGSAESATTGSSCCSSPTPRSSPKRSPLFSKKVTTATPECIKGINSLFLDA